ncbi:hypothetical protein AB0N09_34440 [Streptomyces erythrochromogenes]|uniref:hypothetical protein n=1 Tax=Streptomyces erythrochromogenes TaxID=285574 RepID=UPI003419D393
MTHELERLAARVGVRATGSAAIITALETELAKGGRLAYLVLAPPDPAEFPDTRKEMPTGNTGAGTPGRITGHSGSARSHMSGKPRRPAKPVGVRARGKFTGNHLKILAAIKYTDGTTPTKIADASGIGRSHMSGELQRLAARADVRATKGGSIIKLLRTELTKEGGSLADLPLTRPLEATATGTEKRQAPADPAGTRRTKRRRTDGEHG